ncbi:deleted in malignant brain tumors 1 protein-like [Lytechinus variegatus]|uniref:deleted in malignant brain tumors 1 protein-like n=1 Tax=Lytechinus variegatus TaxID=7654 RepID=UPI001BB0DE66|nr:deleted in malignant brain tumors 1 protein-like [Lytechinus variegatus]
MWSSRSREIMLVSCLIISLISALANAQENNIRLVGGSMMSRFGRVEVLHNGKWGTICDNDWDLRDANVVCRSLGFGQALQAVSGAGFGRGKGPVLFDGVNCSGDEKDIFECDNAGTTSCGHDQDAGVRCAQFPASNIRLVNGSNPTEGRVEVLVNGTWGTVCHSYWEDTDAEVACQSLGFPKIGVATIRANFGEGTGPIWMAFTRCTGDEENLLDCRHTAPAPAFCDHSSDAGVQCDPASILRLVGGSSRFEGRVEMHYNGKWGSVCSDRFNRDEATIVCRTLGLGYPSHVFYDNEFGESNLTDVYKFNCDGWRSSILRCGEITTHDCRYGRNVGLRCHEGIFAPTRLRGGPSNSRQEGRVEVLYNGQWGTVCDRDWTLFKRPSSIVCNSIGLGYAEEAVSGGRYETSPGRMVLDDVFCYGGEPDITQCDSRGFGVGYCLLQAEAGVKCIRSPQASIRLTGGESIYEGRVEVLYRSQWASVCDDGWDLTAANVACQTLGYGPALEAISYAGFGQGSFAIALDELNCTGDEDSLFQCKNLGIGVHDCEHGEDVGVRCSPPLSGSVRVVNGPSREEGRVEVFYDGEWGTVCDDFWDDTDASVVCRMLGLGDSGTAVGCAIYGEGSGDIILDNVRCLGNETDLYSCPSNLPLHHDCAHSEDAGVRCSNSRSIRVVDGPSDSEGRVEVFYNGTWGTVCDNQFDMNAAYVACRSLGYNYALEVISQAGYGMGTGPVILADVRCYGPEENLFQCQNIGPMNAYCKHHEDVGVSCSRSTSTPIRLVNGPDDRSGRVEILFKQQWGTICHDGWDNADAAVVCRSLGLGNEGYARTYAAFGEGTGDVILANLRCTGEETDLMACPSTGPLNNRCLHFQDAGVVCP